MKTARRKFERPLGERRYRVMFVVAVEGSKTEPEYFAWLNRANALVRVHCIPSKTHSSPLQVLKRMREHLRREGLAARDRAWLVVDRDQWTEEQLGALQGWSLEAPQHGFALSNPSFEVWLLLHFEDAAGVSTARECSARLERWLPGYDKGVSTSLLTVERVEAAIDRAKRRDMPPALGWPREPGNTTVYRLVEEILEAAK
jgi:hypothetical protein